MQETGDPDIDCLLLFICVHSRSVVLRAGSERNRTGQFQEGIEKIGPSAIGRIEFSAGCGMLSGAVPFGAAELEYAVLLTAGDR